MLRVYGILVLSALIGSCQSASRAEAPPRPIASRAPSIPPSRTPFNNGREDMKLESASFTHSTAIPRRHTCQGADISVPLSWQSPPDETRSFALIMDDPDAPDPHHPKMVWVHWVLYNIPGDVLELVEGASPLPPSTLEGLNDWNQTGYQGPCPPIGQHRYYITLYALDTEFPDLHQPTKDQLLQAINRHILAKTTLMGTYQKN